MFASYKAEGTVIRSFLRLIFMRVAGLSILVLVSAKHRLRGYRKPNKVEEGDKAAGRAYVRGVVGDWARYLPDGVEFRDRDVLELGPGSSLGTGALLLARGARSYVAADAFRLAGTESADDFAGLIDECSDDLAPTDIVRAKAVTGDAAESFGYEVDSDFDLARMLGDRRFDLVISCAAFEHFDDIDATIAGITAVARPGCVNLHIVDFQTHSSWIRDRDPNNIYRYPRWLYHRLLAFPGQPNRKRPVDYRRAFEANGWTDVAVQTDVGIAESLVEPSLRGLVAPFDRADQEMTILSGVVIAVRPGGSAAHG